MNKKVNIILDTDIGGDCDDAAAIALLNIFALEGKARILGMTHTTSSEEGPALIDIINAYYGHHNVPIGAYSKPGFAVGPAYDSFASKMYGKFPSKYKNRRAVPDATKLLRRKLASLKNEKCKLVCIGQMNNLADLLRSGPDDISQLSGLELVKTKVDEVCLMAGMFNETKSIVFHGKPYDFEYNITSDLASAKYAIAHIDVAVTFVDFLAGYQVLTGGPLLEQNDMEHPVTFAYRYFSGKARESWDPLTVYYAVMGAEPNMDLSPWGTVFVDDSGKTTFVPHKEGKHRYVTLKRSPEDVAKTIDAILIGCERKNNE